MHLRGGLRHNRLCSPPAMKPLRFDEARAVVFERVRETLRAPAVETAPLAEASGRVLAEDIRADRDYPPFNRSARDGFAVHAADAADAPAVLECIGETRAGEPSRFTLERGQTVEIMTGAPGPAGADAVVMVEHTERDGKRITLRRGIAPGRNLIMAGSEAEAGEVVLRKGVRIGYPQIAVLGSVGCADAPVYKRPEVAVLSTGDEIVAVAETPRSFQIRNSNAYSLAAQIARRGARARILPIAADRLDETRRAIEDGLESDMLALSGGVSMGKYDLVAQVLTELGAEFFITGVLIQPGKPLVFGRVAGKPIFGLPGNPISTMVTFELFAAIAVDLLAGKQDSALPFFEVELAAAFRHKPVLTRFLGAQLEGCYGKTRVRKIAGQGSGDVTSFARADCYLVASDDRESWRAGERIAVMTL